MAAKKGAKKGKGKRPRGRPLTYNKDVADEILTRLTTGESLRGICEEEGMPPKGTVLGWVVQDVDGFADRYAHARMAQAWDFHDELVGIADTDPDWQRARLRVDTRKWLMSKLLPKRFGDAAKLEVSGEGGGPVEIAITRRVVRPNGDP